MILCTLVDDNDVVKLLNSISKASRIAQQNLLEKGFEEKVQILGERRKKQRKLMLQKKLSIT